MTRLSFRQGIVRHQTDTSNNPTFLQSVGQYVNLIVSPNPTILTFIHGTTNYLFTEHNTQLNAWGPFIPGMDSWLYWDLNKLTGVRTFGHTVYEPIEASVAPQLPQPGRMWFNTSSRLWFEWSGSVWVEVIRVFACKYASNTAFVSVSISLPLFTGTQVGLTTSNTSGAIAYDGTGKPILKGNKQFFTTEDIFTTGIPTGASLKVNNIILQAQAQQNISAYNVVVYSDFDKIIPALPFGILNRVYGIVEESTNVGDVVNIVTEGIIYNESWNWDVLGAEINAPVYIDNTGQIVLISTGGDSLPVGAVIGPQSILFDPTLYGLSGIKFVNNPYDITITKSGSLVNGDELSRFVSGRLVRIAEESGNIHVGYCKTAPVGGSADFSIYQTSDVDPDDLTLIGSVTFAENSRTATSFTLPTTVINTNDQIVIKALISNGIGDVIITLGGYIR